MRTPRLLVACATRRSSQVLGLCMGAFIIGHAQAQAAQSTTPAPVSRSKKSSSPAFARA